MKKISILFVVSLFLVGVFATTYRVSTVGADSGFDSSYDGGGFDSSYSSSSSDSDSDGGAIFYFVYLCFKYPPLGIAVLGICVLFYFKAKKEQKKLISKALSSQLELLDLNNYDESKQLEIEAFNIYKKVQYAWMNFDEDMLRESLTDEMYNMYLMQLDTLKAKNQKNIMYDIKYLNSYIASREEINGQETIIINMTVSCKDFIIDTTNNNVVRGLAMKTNTYTYELTFVKTTDASKVNNCPQCGAPVEGNNSGVCEYCGSTLINKEYTLVMSKKKMLSQK